VVLDCSRHRVVRPGAFSGNGGNHRNNTGDCCLGGAAERCAGHPFGFLYWQKGMESAMAVHFSADIVLHMIAPLAAPLFTA